MLKISKITAGVRAALAFAAPLLAASAVSLSAHAGLVGDTVTTTLFLGGSILSGPISATVGPGPEGNFFGNQIFDYGDFSFSIASSSNFCGMTCGGELVELKLTSLDLGGLTGVTFSSNLTGVSTVFGTDFVTFSWIDQSLPASTYITANFNGGGQQNVPEPGSMALLGLGLAGLAYSRKRKAQRQPTTA